MERLADSDVVLTSGGVSMGELDLVKALLPELATVHVRRVFMKPGKPLNVATAGDDDRALFFGLPGNPVSALVCFELFVRPALMLMQGRTGIDRPTVPVTLTSDTQTSDRPEYQRGDRADGRGWSPGSRQYWRAGVVAAGLVGRGQRVADHRAG